MPGKREDTPMTAPLETLLLEGLASGDDIPLRREL